MEDIKILIDLGKEFSMKKAVELAAELIELLSEVEKIILEKASEIAKEQGITIIDALGGMLGDMRDGRN